VLLNNISSSATAVGTPATAATAAAAAAACEVLKSWNCAELGPRSADGDGLPVWAFGLPEWCAGNGLAPGADCVIGLIVRGAAQPTSFTVAAAE
jgi:hypothetical protein